VPDALLELATALQRRYGLINQRPVAVPVPQEDFDSAIGLHRRIDQANLQPDA
jgi:hypothetical protein